MAKITGKVKGLKTPDQGKALGSNLVKNAVRDVLIAAVQPDRLMGIRAEVEEMVKEEGALVDDAMMQRISQRLQNMIQIALK